MNYDHASILLSSDYILSIWQADDGALNPHIFIIYNGDTILCLAAIDKSKYIYRSFAIHAVIALDYDRYARSDVILLDKAAAPILQKAVRQMGVDIWHLDRFPKDSLILKYCEDILPRSQYYPYEDNELAIIETNCDWDDYLARKSANFRRSHKRIKNVERIL